MKTTFGIELEFSLVHNQTYLGLERWTKENFGERWELGNDGSVNGIGSELRTIGGLDLSTILKDYKQISKKLLGLYKEDKLYVDSTAGFHIHIGIDGWTLGELKKFHTAFVSSLQFWFDFQPSSRRNNRNCHSSISSEVFQEISSTDHYKAINIGDSLSQNGTIELRVFAGTVQYWKVFNTLQLVNQYIKEIQKIKTFTEIENGDNTPIRIIKNKKLKTFYLKRVKELNPSRYIDLKSKYKKEVAECAE